jgi:hypothetical protein
MKEKKSLHLREEQERHENGISLDVIMYTDSQSDRVQLLTNKQQRRLDWQREMKKRDRSL